MHIKQVLTKKQHTCDDFGVLDDDEGLDEWINQINQKAKNFYNF